MYEDFWSGFFTLGFLLICVLITGQGQYAWIDELRGVLEFPYVKEVLNGVKFLFIGYIVFFAIWWLDGDPRN